MATGDARSPAARPAVIAVGPDGGQIVAAGPPRDVALSPVSVTGPWLAGHLGLPGARQAPVSVGELAGAAVTSCCRITAHPADGNPVESASRRTAGPAGLTD